MVTVTLADRSTVPTYRRYGYGDGTSTNFYKEGNETNWTNVGATMQLDDGETLFTRIGLRNGNTTASYKSYARLVDTTNGNATTGLTDSYTEWSTTTYTYPELEIKNTTGTNMNVQWQVKQSGGQNYRFYHYNWQVLNDTDLAKWERVKPDAATSWNRKYYVENVYMLPLWAGTMKVDGYNSTLGFKSFPVNTIVTKLDLAGSGTGLFQVKGKGFTVSS